MKLEIKNKDKNNTIHIAKAISPSHKKQPIQESDLKKFIQGLKTYFSQNIATQEEISFEHDLRDLLKYTINENEY